MSELIHPTAIVHPEARIGENVEIGAYSIIGPHVVIGDNCKLRSHVVIEGHTTLGKGNEIESFSSIGKPPQDKSYKDEPTEVRIGDNNLFREGVTIHRATMKQNKVTIVGNNGYYMSGVHIAHDCVLGDNLTIASGCLFAGHVHIGDNVQMGGQCGATPFVTIGEGTFVGGASAIDRDIPPFCTALGNRIRLKGINIIGLKRRGYSKDDINEIIEFYRMMESSALSPRAFVTHEENVEEYKDNKVIQDLISFIAASEIGLPPFMS